MEKVFKKRFKAKDVKKRTLKKIRRECGGRRSNHVAYTSS